MSAHLLLDYVWDWVVRFLRRGNSPALPAREPVHHVFRVCSFFPQVGDFCHPGRPREALLLVVLAVGVDHLVRVRDQADAGRKNYYYSGTTRMTGSLLDK